MKKKLSDKKGKVVVTSEIPDEYKILNIIVNGRNIVLNIDNILTIANLHNESEVLNSMNKACSYYHSFSRIESDLQTLIIDCEKKFKIWMSIKKSEYNSKDFNSESAKERAVITDYEEDYLKKTNKIEKLKSYEKQCSIAKKAMEKHVDMIRSIGKIVHDQKSDPKNTSDSDEI